MPFNIRFKSQDVDDLAAMRDIAEDVIERDFIPYACHYDPETLLTKNGELLQTIKIVGFSFEMVQNMGIDLRETIRKAMQEGITSGEFAVWFHTIRRRKNLNPGGEYREGFAQYVHESWKKKHDWEHQFTNELFITVVRDGETGSIKTPNNFRRSFFPEKDDRARFERMQRMHQELQAATTRMMTILEQYGAQRLGVYERDGVHYSAIARFLGKILKLHDEEVPLLDMDLSDQLATHDVTFGFDAMEVRDPDNLRRFGAILTIKEYRELSLAAIDEFLQLPEEFIVTQSMNFITSKKALKPFQLQHYVMTLSEDMEFAESSGLKDMLESNRGVVTDYGQHQLSIFLIANDLKHLSRYMERTVEALSHLGLVAMREDLRLEESYWAQLPGNFNFLKRLQPINTSRLAGFANLSNFPAGKASSNHWGKAVTVFNTAAQTPYFFNFHTGNIGHTTIVGPYGSGKTVLMNFLLSEARKFNNKLFFFDQNHCSEIFIRALGGQYLSLHPSQAAVAFNPFQMEITPINRNLLLLWAEAMLGGLHASSLTATHQQILAYAVDETLRQPVQNRHLRFFVSQVSAQDPILGKRFDPWHSGGPYAAIFDHAADTLDLKTPICGFEMADIVAQPQTIVATLLYVLHRVMLELDGTPTIIVLDEAWQLLDNAVFAPRLHGWLQALTKKNTMAIFATESIEDISQSSISRALFADIPTQFYLPNEYPGEAYKTVFGLNETEFQFLELMDWHERHFLLKKGDESIVARLSLDGMDSVMAVLSANPKRLEIMHQLIQQFGPNPDNWLPSFMEKAATI